MGDKPVINVVSAGDRYNYGDVLYAVVLQEYLKKYEPQIYNGYDYRHYGIIKSDLTSIGGIKTSPIKDLYQCEFGEKSMTLVVGGQVIAANIEVLFKFIKKNKISLYTDLIRYYALSKLGKSRADLLIKKYGCKTKYPYVISGKDMRFPCKIVYSSVGGCCLETDSVEKEEIKNADYVSVRDRLSFEKMKEYRSDTILTPDAAILMSDVFNRIGLRNEVSEEVKAVTGRYIALQVNLKYYRENEAEIIKTLKEFSEINPDTKIVLVPIGYAIMHDDLVALKEIKSKLPQAVLIEKLTIKEIMYLISGAEFFVGTSLHGVVTSMAFEVPYLTVGSGFSSMKLQEFLATWGVKPLNKVFSVDELNTYYSLRNDYCEDLKKSADDQKLLAKRNYEAIFDLIR